MESNSSKRQQIVDALHWRYATKQFDPTRVVSHEDIETIFEAVRLAPTSRGLQPFQVMLVADSEVKKSLREAAFNQAQVEFASHLLIFCARPNIKDRADKLLTHVRQSGGSDEVIAGIQKNIRLGNLVNTLTLSRKSWAARQAYIALGYATLTAAQLEVDACPMEGFLPTKVARILGLTRELFPVAMLALGYRSGTEEVRPKYRLSSEELIFRI